MKPRLLVVDDEPYNRDLLERIFTRQAEVVTVETPAAALAALAAGSFTAVVTDQRLGAHALGTELAASIRARYPHLRIVVVTGFADAPELLAARAAGIIDDVIGKPWLPPLLRARVLG